MEEKRLSVSYFLNQFSVWITSKKDEYVQKEGAEENIWA